MPGEGITTRLLHAERVRLSQEPTLPPIVQTVGFRFESFEHSEAIFTGRTAGIVGARGANPTVALLEAKLAALEGAEAVLVVPSGMAAVTAGFVAFARAGDSVIVDHFAYVGTHGLISDVLPRFGLSTRAVDATNLAEVAAAVDGTTRAIFVESPGSWQLKVPDLAGLARLARSRDLHLVVDGTHATGLLQQPLALGADLAVYSATGSLNGHGDTILGAVAGRAATIARLRSTFRNEMGAAVAPVDAWLLSRALATLKLRLDYQCAAAQRLAEHLEGRPGIRRVIYPGLPSHPQYEVARRQLKAGGGMVLFELDELAAVPRFVDALQVCAFSVGVGGPITTVFYPAHSYPVDSPEELERRGVNRHMIRVCLGLEEIDDVLADVDQALAAAIFE